MSKQKSSWGFILRLVQFTGCLLLIGSGILFAQKVSFVLQAEVAIGDIVKLNQKGEGNDLKYYPVVQFLDADENPVSFESIRGKKKPNYLPGEFVSVYYQKQNPSTASIKGFGELWGLSLLFFSLGCLLLFVSSFVYRFYKRSELLQDLADRKSHRRDPGDALY